MTNWAKRKFLFSEARQFHRWHHNHLSPQTPRAHARLNIRCTSSQWLYRRILWTLGQKKQDENDVKNKVRLLPDQLKKGYPSDLIIIRDDKARDRILVPKCQRQRLVVKEHETMLHVDGTRVHHELSRKFYWPNMVKQIKAICKACQQCQAAKVRR